MARQENAGESADVKVQQVLMTLSGLASTGATALPGESADQQTARIKAGIEKQLAMPSLATAGQWALQWVGQSSDQANLAYIARNTAAAEYAVVFRGTVNVDDLLEDEDVATLQDFAGGALYGKVSKGSNYAFNEIANKTNLVSTLQALVKASSGTPTVYVTGHSLGGAMATMFSLYLSDQLKDYACNVQAYTFAAPSAGNSTFANSFNQQKHTPVCVWNQYDVIPNSWANLETVRDNFFPNPGPAATQDIKHQIQQRIDKAKGQYTQTAQQLPLNPEYTTYCSDDVGKPVDWQSQMGFQHAANTYLGLLGRSKQQLLPDKPVVTGVSPNSGHSGDTVTMTGKNFTPDCTVSFYLSNASVSASSVVVKSDTSITCKVPAGILLADVRVINYVDASDKVDADHFQYLL